MKELKVNNDCRQSNRDLRKGTHAKSQQDFHLVVTIGLLH